MLKVIKSTPSRDTLELSIKVKPRIDPKDCFWLANRLGTLGHALGVASCEGDASGIKRLRREIEQVKTELHKKLHVR